MELEQVKAEASRRSMWAHLATVGSDGKPDVVPVHPAWVDGTLWIMTFAGTVKARNVAANPDVAMHWQVDESGDGVEIWGTARVVDDVETKRRLWDGVFDYDLNEFAPDGPDSPAVVFVAVEPERALCLKHYGAGGREVWHRP